jgi:kinesin family member 6/9
MIKRYEKEIRDLKQELAMHDTLQNRGRITYDQYAPDQQVEIRQASVAFLAGETDEINDFDSLRKVREYFT